MRKYLNPWSVGVLLLVALVAGLQGAREIRGKPSKPNPTSVVGIKTTNTPTKTATATASSTATQPPTETPTVTTGGTATATDTPQPTLVPPVYIVAYPDGPACPDSGPTHDPTAWHDLWDEARGCHYNHEHGDDPTQPEVAAAFPDMDLYSLLGNAWIGSTNHSGPAENLVPAKHGGFKWTVNADAPHGCELGFENGQVAVDAFAIEHHGYGNYAVEFNARKHSINALLRQCIDDSGDYGYIYTTQLADFGQPLFSYQGRLMDGYPSNPIPSYPVGLAPYLTSHCIHCGNKQDTIPAILAANANVPTTWTNKSGDRTGAQTILGVLFRGRDLYQVADQADLEYPYTFLFVCSLDGGITFNPVGCRYNNSTTAAHEVQGTIPDAWDGLPFDTDPRAGRVTGTIWTDDFGIINPDCTTHGPGCRPVVMLGAYTGFYSSMLIPAKEDQFRPSGNPEHDIYFCGPVGNQTICNETVPGAQPSGWIGADN